MLARSYLVSRAKLVQQRSQSAGVALEATRIPFDSLASAAEGVSKSGGHGDSAKSVTGKVNSRSVNLKRLPTNACRRCFREGHLADACDSEMPTDISLRCLGCGFYGHKLSDCRMAKSRKLSCKRCSGIGHMSYICRQDRVVESQERRSADLTKSEEKSVPADGDQGDKKKSALLSVVEPTAPAASWLSILNCTTGIEGLDDGPHDPLKANVSLRSYDVDVGDLEVSVMLDTGAGRSFIHKSVRDSLNSVYIRETRAISASATLADSTVMRFTEAIRVTIVTPQPAGAEAGVWLLVSPVLSCNLILGMNALRSLSLLVFVSSDATLLRASLTAVDVRRAISDSATRIMTCQDNPPGEEQPVDSSSSGCVSPLPDESSPSCCDFTSPDDCGMPELLYDTQLCRIVDGHDDVEGFNKFISATMLNWGSKNTQDDLKQSPECDLATSSPSPSDDQSPCALPPVFGDVGYGQSTVFVGLTPDRHVCSDGSTRMALRYTYDIPWLSDKRLPRPMEEDWARLFKKDAMLVQKLKKEGHFDAYDTVFRKYEDQGAMVEIPIKSDDFAQIDAVTALLLYHIFRFMLRVRCLRRGIIGNGRGDEDPKANTLRSTIPSLTVFRCYEHVYLSDLKMAFYQLANAPAAKYVFCIVWNSRVFRLRGPGMGAPHAPSCLQDAVCRLGKLSIVKLPTPIFKKLESEKFGRKCICWKPYMDDVVLGATSRSLLDVAHTAFTSACDRRGFPFQPAKERDRPPAEGESSVSVLGYGWYPQDVLGPQRASQQLPSRGMLPANPTYSTTTRRDILSFINGHYDPLGLFSNIILGMRLLLKLELQNDPFLDAFVSCECYDGVQRLAMAFASVTPVPRLLSPPVTQGSKFYIFVDSSTTAYGVVITTAAFVPVRALARMHPSPRSKWSIVRKELVAILAGLMLFEDCLKVLFSSCLTPTTTLVPIVFTDNSANFHRIQGFLKGKSLDPKLPAWERRSISFAGEYLSRVDGQIYHLPGTVNPADAFSRGTMLSTPIHLDRKLHSAVHCALQLPGYGGVMLLAVNEDEQNDDDHHDRDPGLIDESWLEDIKRSQKDDPFLARILVKDPTVYLGRVCRLYEVKDGAVYHAVTGGLVVPGASCRRLIEKLHTLFGHIGFAKLYNSTYRILYLGRLADFRKVQHSCKTCFATRGHRAIHHRLGRRLLRSTAPWELVGIDLCGPYKFSDAEGESEAMLVVCVDACTKFMTVEVAHHYCNEEELLRCIQKICYRHGFPLCFYSDCDRRFSGAKLCSWLYVHGLQWVQTPPYCCRLRGWNEAPHKLLLSVVRSLILDDQDQGRVRVPWYTYVDKACWIVNNICRSGSNVDTFSSELHFTHGRCLPPVIGDRRLSDEARRFMAGLGILPVPSERALSAYLDDYRKLLVDAMDLSIAENIDQALRSRGVLAAESVVRRDLSSGFKIGDLVVRYNHHAANKLAPRWLIDKPYRITALNGSVAQLDGGEDSNGRRVLTTEFLGNLKSIPQENNVSDESEDE